MPGGIETIVCGTPFEPLLRDGRTTMNDIIDVAISAGAEGVEFRPGYWRDKEAELPAAARRILESGLDCIYASSASVDPMSAGTSAAEEILRDLQDAQRMGARILRVFAGRRELRDPGTFEPLRARFEAARSAGIEVAVENYVRAPGNTPDEVRALVAELDEDVAGVNLDLGNYVKNGFDPVSCAQQLADRIIYCHFKDIRFSANGPEVTVPGEGDLDLASVLAVLQQCPRPVPLGFEFRAAGDAALGVRAAVSYVRDFAERRESCSSHG